MTPEFLNATAALLQAIAWPFVLLLALLVYRRPIAKLLENMKSVKLGNFAAEVQNAVTREAASLIGADPAEEAKEVTPEQIEAADRVRRLAARDGFSAAREEMLALARKYELLRATMPEGKSRTRTLDALVLQMRTLGLACQPFLPEFANSNSPGERLAAIALLQVKPDPAYCDWLARRLKEEEPFIVYHAAVALLAAVRHADQSQRRSLKSLEHTIQEVRESVPPGSNRHRVLGQVLDELNKPG
jgi:hypothetical protein